MALFEPVALTRAGKAVRLESDLEINLHAVAVILDLLERIDRLQGSRDDGATTERISHRLAIGLENRLRKCDSVRRAEEGSGDS